MLGRPKIAFPGFAQGDGAGDALRFRQHDRELDADSAGWPFLIAVSTPSLLLFDGIRKGRMVGEARVVSEPYETIRKLRAIPGDHLRGSARSACCMTLSI